MEEGMNADGVSLGQHHSSFNRDSSFEEILNAASRAERSLDEFLHNSGMRVIYESEASSDVESDQYSVRSDTFDSDFDSLTSELDHLIEREQELRRELDLAEECCQEVLENSGHEQREFAGTTEGASGEAEEKVVREHKREFSDLLQHWRKAEKVHSSAGLQGTMEDDSRWIITYSEANPSDSYSVRKGVSADRVRTSLTHHGPQVETDQAGDESSSDRFSESFATVSDGGMDSESEESKQEMENILDLISPAVFNKMTTAQKIAALEKAISLENVVALESIEALLAEALGESKVSEKTHPVHKELKQHKVAVAKPTSPPKKDGSSQTSKRPSYYFTGNAKDDVSKFGSVPSVLMLSHMSDDRSETDLGHMPIKDLMWSITVSVAELLYGERPDSIEAAVISKVSTVIGNESGAQELAAYAGSELPFAG